MSQHPLNRSPSEQSFPRPCGTLRPYRVILLQTPNTELMFVVRTVMELTRLCRAEATHKMWQAYHCGRALLLTTHKERAELYVDQFADRGLPTTIEPA